MAPKGKIAEAQETIVGVKERNVKTWNRMPVIIVSIFPLARAISFLFPNFPFPFSACARENEGKRKRKNAQPKIETSMKER